MRHHCPDCAAVPDHQVTTVGDVRVHPHHAEHARQILATERGTRLAAATSTGIHPAQTTTATGVPDSTGQAGPEQPAAFHDGDIFVLALTEPAGEMAWRRVGGRWLPGDAHPEAADILTADDPAIRQLWATSPTPPRYTPAHP